MMESKLNMRISREGNQKVLQSQTTARFRVISWTYFSSTCLREQYRVQTHGHV